MVTKKIADFFENPNEILAMSPERREGIRQAMKDAGILIPELDQTVTINLIERYKSAKVKVEASQGKLSEALKAVDMAYTVRKTVGFCEVSKKADGPFGGYAMPDVSRLVSGPDLLELVAEYVTDRWAFDEVRAQLADQGVNVEGLRRI